METTDPQSELRRIVSDGDQDAFRAGPETHVDLVFSTALRVLGDRGLAEDVTWELFTSLAQKPAGLDAGMLLAGWWHRATRFSAGTGVRGENRRRRNRRRPDRRPAAAGRVIAPSCRDGH